MFVDDRKWLYMILLWLEIVFVFKENILMIYIKWQLVELDNVIIVDFLGKQVEFIIRK